MAAQRGRDPQRFDRTPGKWFATGTTSGDVQLYDTTSGQAFPTLQGSNTIRFFAFSPDSKQLVIATEDHLISRMVPNIPNPPPASWRDVPLDGVSYLAFSPDGEWLGVICINGDLWFYRRSSGRWTYLSSGVGFVVGIPGRFSSDSSSFATVDAKGRALTVDMHASVFQ